MFFIRFFFRWTGAIYNRFLGKTKAELNQFLGLRNYTGIRRIMRGRAAPTKATKATKASTSTTPTGTTSVDSLPIFFDPRLTWSPLWPTSTSTCTSFSEIRDQGACGSCWVFSSVAVITDRICIAYGGATTPTKHVSAEDALACCGVSTCGSCSGGW